MSKGLERYLEDRDTRALETRKRQPASAQLLYPR